MSSPFVISEIQSSDFDAMASFTPDNGGDLTSGSLLDHWPTDDPGTARRRSLWSLHRQRALTSDPAVRGVKAVDPSSDEIVATSLWHVFPNGPPKAPAPPAPITLGEHDDEVVHRRRGGFPDDFPLELWEHSMQRLYADRRGWIGGGRTWILTQVPTREGWRRRGAGSALVSWGLEQARQEGCPVFVEGGHDVAPLCEKLGFRKLDSAHRADRSLFGGEGEIIYTRMVAKPAG